MDFIMENLKKEVSTINVIEHFYRMVNTVV